MEFSRQEHWSGLLFPPPGNLPEPDIKPVPLLSPAMAGGFFTTEPPRKILVVYILANQDCFTATWYNL